MADVLLGVEKISRRFGGLLAVDQASFTAVSGRITALIGPNGAGKTTLFAIISGFLTPSHGSIRYDGADITGEPPYKLARRGIARTFQIVQPFGGLTVRENIAIGAHLSRPTRVHALAAAGEIARSVDLDSQLDRPAASLTLAGRKRLELA
jgi:branched-chain amino acid transport system ATP-binding protein